MLTSAEIYYIKDIIQQLAALVDSSEYTEKEVEDVLELLDSLKPTKTEEYLDCIKMLNKEER